MEGRKRERERERERKLSLTLLSLCLSVSSPFCGEMNRNVGFGAPRLNSNEKNREVILGVW